MLRGQESLFGGLWGLPMISRESFDELDARRALREAGISARLQPEPTGRVEHLLTHRHLAIDVFRAKAARGQETETRRRFHPAKLDRVGISKLTRKLLTAVLAG